MRNTRIFIVALFLAVMILPLKAQNEATKQITPEKKNLIIKFIQVSGNLSIPGQIVNDVINNFKSQIAVIPDKFWDEASKEADTTQFVNMLVSLYDESFSEGELKDLIKFFESTTGKKYVAASPKIIESTYNMSQQWGTAYTNLVVDKLKKAGYLQNEEQQNNKSEQTQQEKTK